MYYFVEGRENVVLSLDQASKELQRLECATVLPPTLAFSLADVSASNTVILSENNFRGLPQPYLMPLRM